MNVVRAGQRAFTQLHVVLFRLTKARVGGRIFNAENVLLTTTGRKSGKTRVTPLVVTPDGDRLVFVASNGGAARHPDWYLNLTANPEVSVRRGTTTVRMHARTASPEERAALWPRILATYKGYAGYQRKTQREIPLVICELSR